MLSGIVVIDLAGFVLLLLVALTGGIIKWHLPPGSGHGGHGHGAGHGHDFSPGDAAGPKLLWGMDRHDWGDVHFWLSVAFLVVMAVHLYQHRYWLRACLTRGGTCGTGEGV
ncbi:DUF4405 domain-containing protein [Candidatus Ozemobacteraceae bacterium]|nr:DUF4405 domain-containing protein [Candidatus Ozemobacteraceae bacterium]